MLLSREIVGLAGLFIENRISSFKVGQGVAGGTLTESGQLLFGGRRHVQVTLNRHCDAHVVCLTGYLYQELSIEYN